MRRSRPWPPVRARKSRSRRPRAPMPCCRRCCRQSARSFVRSTQPMDEHVLTTYLRADEVFVRGQGARLWDADGRQWLDFLGGIAVSALGHNHPRLVAELTEQLGTLIHTSNLFRHPYTDEVATRVARLTGLEAVFFTNS